MFYQKHHGSVGQRLANGFANYDIRSFNVRRTQLGNESEKKKNKKGKKETCKKKPVQKKKQAYSSSSSIHPASGASSSSGRSCEACGASKIVFITAIRSPLTTWPRGNLFEAKKTLKVQTPHRSSAKADIGLKKIFKRPIPFDPSAPGTLPEMYFHSLGEVWGLLRHRTSRLAVMPLSNSETWRIGA